MKTSEKWIVGVTSAALVSSAIAPIASAASFSDIEKSDHKDAILALAKLNLVSGYPDGTFKPNAIVTRANVTKFLGKWLVSEGYEIPADYDKEARFTDLPTDSADQELVKYAALVKDEGVFKGSNNQLMFTNNMTREQMALVLVRAINTVYGVDLIADYKAAKFESKITDLDKAMAGENREAIIALEFAKITNVTAFNPKNSLTRGQFSSFLYRAITNVAPVELTVKTVTVKDATTLEVTLSDDKTHTVTLPTALKENEETTVEFVIDGKTYSAKVTYVVDKLAIGSVNAMNDTTVEVKFTQAINKDFIREAEQSGKYFAIYKKGESIRGEIIQSETVNFSADGKSAEFVLDQSIESGKEYFVAMLDGENAAVANVVLSYGPTELREAADQPDLEVSAVSDKITLKFSEKMKNSALKISNYDVYDVSGKKIGTLDDFVENVDGSSDGVWVNAITKKEAEFTLDSDPKSNKFLAGKTYKIKLTTNLETDDNKTLSKDDLVLIVKTPSIEEAAPTVSIARVAADDKIVLVFDKDVKTLNLSNLNNLVEIKTLTGKKVVTYTIEGAEGTAPNEIILTLTGEKLDPGTTYNIEIPANLVTNAVFPNATSQATSNLKATAQDSKAIKSVTAKLVADPKHRNVGNLVLTFDQRPTLESVKHALEAGKIKIFDGTDEYKSTATAATNIKYFGSDTTGKSVVIGHVNAPNAFKFGTDSFAPISGETYTVEIAAGAIKVDGFGGKNPSNQSKLKAKVNGVPVSAPDVDRVTLKSAVKMVIKFKDAIDSTVDLNKITVAGYEADPNDFYTAKDLRGSKHFSATVSDNILTLTAKSGVKFATGADGNGSETGDNLISFAKDAVVSKDSAISIGGKNIAESSESPEDGKLDGVKFVDNAAPVLLFAEDAQDPDYTNLLFTFTENIEVEGKIAPQFRTGGDAAKPSVGSSATAFLNRLGVTFTKAWKDEDTTLLEVTAEYRAGQTNYIADAFGNKVKTTKVTGVDTPQQN